MKIEIAIVALVCLITLLFCLSLINVRPYSYTADGSMDDDDYAYYYSEDFDEQPYETLIP